MRVILFYFLDAAAFSWTLDNRGRPEDIASRLKRARHGRFRPTSELSVLPSLFLKAVAPWSLEGHCRTGQLAAAQVMRLYVQ
jgi:hypothetical protein